MARGSDLVPGVSDYRTVDYRSVVRCPICANWLEYRDKKLHSDWHSFVGALFDTLSKKSTIEIQPELIPPPF